MEAMAGRSLGWLSAAALGGMAVLAWMMMIAGSYALGSDCRFGRTTIINGTPFPLTNARFQFHDTVLWSGRVDRYDIVDIGLEAVTGKLELRGFIGDTGKTFSVTMYAMGDVDDRDVYLITENQTLAWTIQARESDQSPTTWSAMRYAPVFMLGVLSCVDRGLWRKIQSTFH